MASKKSKKKKPAKKKSVKKTRLPATMPRSVKTPAKRKPAQKRASKPKKTTRRRTPSINVETELKQEFKRRNPATGGAVPAAQMEDFEGVSRAEEADSESVDELVEEGNVFEAAAVAGVEEADNKDEREVHTHELPEDDVPEEYLDQD